MEQWQQPGMKPSGLARCVELLSVRREALGCVEKENARSGSGVGISRARPSVTLSREERWAELAVSGDKDKHELVR